MAIFAPIFDRSGRQVAWLVGNILVSGFDAKSLCSINGQGEVVGTDTSNQLGTFENDLFSDKQGSTVAFVDRTLSLEHGPAPADHNRLSPLLAQAITNWSMLPWTDYLVGVDCRLYDDHELT